jgi:hypothetical protein
MSGNIFFRPGETGPPLPDAPPVETKNYKISTFFKFDKTKFFNLLA